MFTQRICRTLQIHGVPQHDRRCHQIQTTGTVTLLLKAAGTKDQREGLNACLKALRPQDTLVV